MRSSPFLVARAGLVGVCACATFVTLAGCDSQRKEDCGKFLPAMSGMQSGTPSVETVDQVLSAVAGIHFTDVPLEEYATNYKNTLTVLSGTLKLKATAGPEGPPDGTDDVIKRNLKDARTDFDDITRYCSQ